MIFLLLGIGCEGWLISETTKQERTNALVIDALISPIDGNEITTISELECQPVLGEQYADVVAENLAYEWSINGSDPVATQYRVQLDPSMVRPDDDVSCRIRVSSVEDTTSEVTASVRIGNVSPTVTARVDNNTGMTDVAYTAESLECIATVTDPEDDASPSDDDVTAMSFEWSKVNGGVLQSEGNVYVVDRTETNPGDTLVCTITATDSYGAVAMATQEVQIENTDPSISVELVGNNADTFYADEQVTCSITSLSDIDETDEELAELQLEFLWEWVGSPSSLPGASDDTQIVSLDPTDIQVGDQIACSVTVTDSYGTSISSNQDTISISNSLPQVTDVAIDGTITTTTTNSTLTCQGNITDINQPNIASNSDYVSYRWYADGTEIQGEQLSSLMVTPETALVDAVVTCKIFVRDMHMAQPDPSQYAESQSVTVLNTLPHRTDTASQGVDIVDSSGGSSQVDNGDTLTCNAYFDDVDIGASGVQMLTYSYYWYKDTSTTAIHQNENVNSTSDTFLLPGDPLIVAPTESIYCQVSVSDGATGAQPVQSEASAQVLLMNTAPEGNATGGAILQGNASPGYAFRSDVLTCVEDFIDIDGQSLSYTYDWHVNGTVEQSGPTSDFDLQAAAVAVGDSIYCTIMADDGIASSAWNVSSSVTIQNSPPTAGSSGGAILQGNNPPSTGDTLTCRSDFTDADGDVLSYTIDWFVDGVSVQNGPNSEFSILANNSNVGDDVMCTVTAGDGTTTVTSANSTVLTIVNTPPEAPEVGFYPSEAAQGEDLECFAEVYDIDDNLAEANIQYEWTSPQSSNIHTGAVLPGSDVIQGYVWDCQVTATDDSGGTSTSSQSIDVEHSCALGSAATCPASSCEHILQTGYATGNGNYWIDLPIGGPTAVLCEMTVDDGGWMAMATEVLNTMQNSSDTWEYMFTDGTMWLLTPETDVVWAWGANNFVGISGEFTYSINNGSSSNSFLCSHNPSITPFAFTGIPGIGCIESITEYWRPCATGQDTDAGLISLCEAGFGLSAGNDLEDVQVYVRKVVEEVVEEEEEHCDPNSSNCEYELTINGEDIGFSYISGGTNPASEFYVINDDFMMMQTEVTQAIFRAVMGYNTYDDLSSYASIDDTYPANFVNWDMAASFANHLTEEFNAMNPTDQRSQCYSCTGTNTAVDCVAATTTPYDCDGFRLPTEAEWEFAARSETSEHFWTGEGTNDGGMASTNNCDLLVQINDSSGTSYLRDYAWFCGNSDIGGTRQMHTVADKLPNGNGLYDMHGNVQEWTADGDIAWPPSNGQMDPYQAPDTTGDMIVRGGHYEGIPGDVNCSYRDSKFSNNRDSRTGFRVVIDPPN